MLNRTDKIGDYAEVVVTIPAYNEERYIGETIASLQAQTHKDFKAVISDNASTDGTEAICRRVALEDPRFIYVRQPENIGAANNFNWLLDNTNSRYFMWLGAHDLIAPTFLEAHLAVLNSDDAVALSYANARCIDRDSNLINIKDCGKYHRLEGSPGRRYIQTFKRMGPCEPINNLFRRSAIADSKFKPIPGCDRLVICHAAYRGLFNKIEDPLYVRRITDTAKSQSETRIVRITGSAKTAASKLQTALEFRREFKSLGASLPERLAFEKALWTKYLRRTLKDMKHKLRRARRTG